MTGRVDVIRELAGIVPIEDEWRALALRRSNAFITPEWFRAFHENAASTTRPIVVAVHDASGALLGVMPFVSASKPSSRQLRFAGASLGDYFHPAAAKEHEDEVAALATTALARESDGWNMLVLHNVDRAATWPRSLRTAAVRRTARLDDEPDVLPFADISGGWEAFLASRSRNLRSQIGRKLRALESGHEVRFRRTETAEELPVDMSAFFYLHHRRWQTRGGQSSLGATRVRAFHHDFAAAAFARGWLRLWFLEVDGRPVAAWYGWRLGERYAYYSAGFEPDWADASVGLVLFAHTIRAAVDEGAAEYDMLLGNESYKSRFATGKREVGTVLITRSLHPGRAMAATEIGLRRAGRRLPDRISDPLRSAARMVITRLPTGRVI